MADEAPSIALVVLNWNGVADTLECLASLRHSRVPVHAIVVDNGSSGTDVGQIRESGLADIVIETGANLGYAEGNNVGLRHALESALGFEVVGVLNNDTFVDPHCFGDLAQHLRDADGRQRALAPTVLYADNPTATWFAGGVVDRGWPRHLQPVELEEHEEALRESEWLTGCCIVARSATWRHTGLFDSRYYLLVEDCEWSLRARSRGVGLFVATRSSILHKVSRSYVSSGPESLLASFYFIRNGLCFDYAYRRRYLLHFMVRHLLRPTLAEVVRLRFKQELVFGWLGALAFVSGQKGRAPELVTHLAERRPV
jgi:GT2 family glycosyltransferase